MIFTGGCNFRCPFCHNPELVLTPDKGETIPFEAIADYLEKKRGWIDGVVITGGEPTIWPDLADLIQAIKALGYPVKLDTNGSNPDVLEDLIDRGMLDYIAMDFKTVFDKYGNATGLEVAVDDIKRSIDLILRSGLDYEFRTTVYPGAVTPADLVEMADYLSKHGAKRFIIQQYKPGRSLDPAAEEVCPYDLKTLEDAQDACSRYLPTKLR